MRTTPSPTNTASRTKKAWLIALTLFALLFISLAIYDSIQSRAHQPNLGSQLEYIGQRTYGCFLWWCESEPYTEYYFATDLTEEQMMGYFRGARYMPPPEPGDGAGSGVGIGGANFTSDSIGFQTASNQTFGLTYYHNIKPSQMDWNLKDTNKLYGISMTDKDYAVAKGAL